MLIIFFYLDRISLNKQKALISYLINIMIGGRVCFDVKLVVDDHLIKLVVKIK